MSVSRNSIELRVEVDSACSWGACLHCTSCDRRIEELSAHENVSDIVASTDEHRATCPGKPLPTDPAHWIYDVKCGEFEYGYGFIVDAGEVDGWALFDVGEAPNFVEAGDIITWKDSPS